MKTITASYKKWGLFNKTITGYMPEKWDEVTDTQLIAIAEIYMNEAPQYKSVAVLLDMPLGIVKQFSTIQLYELLQHLQFITDYRPRNCFIIKDVHNLVPPRHKLNQMTFTQFVFLENYFEECMGQVSDESLNNFVAHLYLRQNEAFDHSLLSARAKQRIITTIPTQTKMALLINYRLIREWLATVYPLIFFQKKETAKADQIHHEKPVSAAQQWMRVYESIVGDDIIHFEEYGQKEVHIIFKYLTKKIKENAGKKS